MREKLEKLQQLISNFGNVHASCKSGFYRVQTCIDTQVGLVVAEIELHQR